MNRFIVLLRVFASLFGWIAITVILFAVILLNPVLH